MIKHRILRYFIFVFVLLLLPIGNGAAKTQKTQEGQRRSPQILRDLYTTGNPESRWLKTEDEGPAPSILAAPAAYPPSWGTMVFQSYRGYRWDLYTLQPDGTERKLTGGAGVSVFPALQKNGYQVAFENDKYGNVEIFSIPAAGGKINRLTEDSAYDSLPTWSPDGNRIAFRSDRWGNSDLFAMDSNGGNVTPLAVSPDYDGEPTWSPDGSQIAFVSDRSGSYALWVMNADGTNQHQITPGPTALTPDWSPKGDTIAFAQDSDGDGFYEVWLVDPEGSNLRKFHDYFDPLNSDVWAPAWSPDGEWLAYVVTTWVEIDGRWYWKKSIFYQRQVVYPNDEYQPSADTLVWHVDWAANDTLPPGPCTVTPPAQQAWSEIPVRFSAQDQGPSGIFAYDGQYRLPGGEWQNFVHWIHSDGAIYPGSSTGQVEFRCRAYDWGGSVGEWSTTPALSPVYDAVRPVSQVLRKPGLSRGNSISISWGGFDQGSGIASYDIFVKDGFGGDWSRWLTGTGNQQGVFTGQSGHTYFFRSQAHDKVGHQQPWQPATQASTTFYATLLSISVTDQRDNLVPPSSISLQPTAVYTSLQSTAGRTLFYLQENLTHSVNAASPGFTSPPTATLATIEDGQYQYVLSPLTDAVINGGFETGTLGGWTVSGSGASVNTPQPHSGEFALQLSHATPITSSISQAITVENTLHQPTLSFLYRIPDDLTEGVFEVQVKGTLSTTVLSTAAHTDAWMHAWADFSPYAGQLITLTMTLRGTSGAVQVDEVSIGAWETPLMASIFPNEWPETHPTSLIINGSNFLATPEVYLDDDLLTSITWISPTQITANVPANYPAGIYDMRVSNPGGASSILPSAVQITTHSMLLPLVQKADPNLNISASPDYAMVGYDNARTGYNRGEPGASRYSLEWSLQLPTGNCNYTAPFVVADGILLTHGSCDAQLLALDAETGQQLWYSTDPDFGWINAATIANGMVYYEFANILHALDLYNGTEVWRASAYPGWSPLVAEHRLYTMSTGFVAYNASSGTKDWEKTCGGTSPASSILAYDQGVLYSWLNGNFQAINPETGGAWWSLSIAPLTYGWIYPMPVISGRTAIVTTAQNQTIYAINLDTHQVQWSVNDDLINDGEPFVAVADGVVYVVNEQLKAYDLTNGNLLWSFSTNDPDEDLGLYPIVTQKYIYVSSSGDSQHTYVLDRSTHQVVWQAAGSIIAVADGFLYVMSVENHQNRTISAYRAQEP